MLICRIRIQNAEVQSCSSLYWRPLGSQRGKVIGYMLHVPNLNLYLTVKPGIQLHCLIMWRSTRVWLHIICPACSTLPSPHSHTEPPSPPLWSGLEFRDATECPTGAAASPLSKVLVNLFIYQVNDTKTSFNAASSRASSEAGIHDWAATTGKRKLASEHAQS